VEILGSLAYDEAVAACLGRGLCAAECEGPTTAAIANVHRKLRAFRTKMQKHRPAKLPVLPGSDRTKKQDAEVV